MGKQEYEIKAESDFTYRLKDDRVVVTSGFKSSNPSDKIVCDGLVRVMSQFDIDCMAMVRCTSPDVHSEFYFRNDSYPVNSDERPNMSLKVMPEACQVELTLATEELSGMAGIPKQSYQGMRIGDAAMYLHEAILYLEKANNPSS